MIKIKPGELKHKTRQIYFNSTTKEHDRKLVNIEYWIIKNFGMLVTCAWRRQRHSNDLHGLIPVRAKDIRSWCYKDPQLVVNAINARWIYDPARPHMKVAVLHNSGQGRHIHLQSHPATRRRV